MKIFRNIINLVIILTIVLPVGSIGTSIVQANPPLLSISGVESNYAPGYALDRVIVKFKSGVQFQPGNANHLITGRSSLDALFSSAGVQAQRPLIEYKEIFDTKGISQIRVLQVVPTLEIKDLVELLSADPSVEWAEPDYLAYPADTTPNDPNFPDQWGLIQIEAPATWDVITGSSSVSIAIIDSGVDDTHPDLAGQMWVNPGEIPSNGLDDDNNGYIDDVKGWDFVNNNNELSDDHGHGTQVAGVAAAATNNNLGIAGVCWDCKIMPVKVMQASGVANYSDIAAGVLYAAQKGAKVINISLGGYSNSAALEDAVQTATDTYGAVVVAGAGNDNLNTPFYPAAYESVLAVAGTDQSDAKAGLSNYGDWIDLAAPAVAITTTFQGGDYGAVDGTSYAAPFVAGVAGLLRSQNSTWSPNTVRAQILHTTDDIDGLNPGLEGLLGSGRANANTAVITVAQPFLIYQSYAVDGLTSGRPEPGTTVNLDMTLYNDWVDASNVQATLTSSDPNVTILEGSTSFGDILTYGSGTNNTPFRFTVDNAAPYNHDIEFLLNLTTESGYSSSISCIVTTSSGTEYVSGLISSDTYWTNEKTYIVNGNVLVSEGVTLTIGEGTQVMFHEATSLVVGGTLIARGNEGQYIYFGSQQNDSSWGQIRFNDTSIDALLDIDGNYVSGSVIEFVEIEDSGNSALYLDGASPLVLNTEISDSNGSAIYAFNSTSSVVNNYFHHNSSNSGGGIYAEESTLKIISNILEFNLGGAISLWHSDNTLIQGNSIKGNSAGAGGGIKIRDSNNTSVKFNTIIENHADIGGGICIDDDNNSSELNNNLIANNQARGIGDWFGYGGGAIFIYGGPIIHYNTIVNNSSAKGAGGIFIANATVTDTLVIEYNNLLGNETFNLQTIDNQGGNITAPNNFWGTTDSAAIDLAIFDFLDDFDVDLIEYSPFLTNPEPTAPAYVVDVNISPDTTLGIQTATFDIEFSRTMSQTIEPVLSFQSAKHGTWSVYDVENSGLPHNRVNVIATDLDGSHWFGTHGGGGVAHFDGVNWTVYNTENSGLPTNDVRAIVTDQDGSHWFGTVGGGVAHFDGTIWTVYNPDNSGLPSNYVSAIAIDPDGSHWFGTVGGGVAHFDGATWTVYNADNSGLPSNDVQAVTTDPDGSHWFGTINGGGVAYFDGVIWTVYNTGNSGLPENSVYAIATDLDGSHWFGTGSGVVHFDGATWTIYNTGNSSLPENSVYAIATEPDGSHWFGTQLGGAAHFDGAIWTIYNPDNSGLSGYDVFTIARDPDGSHWFGTAGNGGAVLWNHPAYPIVENAHWIDAHTYRATYDITSLIPRDDYVVSVTSAVGTDDIEIAPVVGYTFTVDYAGAIGDTTPPPSPAVTACAGAALDTLTAEWSANDPDSLIDLYSYAIGTKPGGSDVVNWTNTTATSFVRSGLSLIGDQPYFISVKARNEGGLWSPIAVPDAVYAGSGVCSTTTTFVYLPLVIR